MESLKQIGDIQIFAEIHRGAITVLYKGYQSTLERVVLLKVLRAELNNDTQLAELFLDEARLTAQIQHQNVVAIYDYGQEDARNYIVTEFVDGETLAQIMNMGKLPWDIACNILWQTTRGLRAAHAKKILHRDIKPPNILVSHSGYVKLADFGMADLRQASDLQTQEIVGTIGYIPPEEILGKPSDERSDLFALGATFYEMLTGQPAFPKSDSEYFDAVINRPPVWSRLMHVPVPEEVLDICQHLVAIDPSQRYQHCGELLRGLELLEQKYGLNFNEDILEQYLKNPESHVTPSPPSVADVADSVQAPSRRSWRAFSVVSAIVIVLIAFFVALAFRSDGNDAGEKVLSNLPAERGPALSSDVDADQVSGDKKQESNRTTELVSSPKELEEVRNTPDAALPREGAAVALDSLTISRERSARTGLLMIKCSPWAAVFIDGDSVGTTPFREPLRLKAGKHDMELRNPDFPEHQTEVEVVGDSLTTVELSLWSLVGQLNLEVSPWAQVYIDGDSLDTIPPQSRPFVLSPGTHRLSLQHPQLGRWETEISMAAGETLNLKFNLRNLVSNETKE